MQSEKLSEKIGIFTRKHGLILLLILFLIVDIFFSTLVFKNQQSLQNRQLGQKTFLQKETLTRYPFENIPKISEINGPRIDDQAASVEKVPVCGVEEKTSSCSTLPTGIWMLLLFAYGALLIFNLTYNFKNATKIQWFWELLYTLLAIFAWYAWDSCGMMNAWYPEFVLKVGIIIYGIYLYFLGKKKESL